jgi:hypothetical protein
MMSRMTTVCVMVAENDNMCLLNGNDEAWQNQASSLINETMADA